MVSFAVEGMMDEAHPIEATIDEAHPMEEDGGDDEVSLPVGEAKEEEKDEVQKTVDEALEKPGEAWKEDEAEPGEFNWMKQCSKHLSHMEHRMMEGEFLGHEVVRQIQILMTTFFAAPQGGLGLALEAVP